MTAFLVVHPLKKVFNFLISQLTVKDHSLIGESLESDCQDI